ncbi:hypothetical protein C2G38_2097166 [Gigaspora rosea]|uniref:Zn(2)-C6 fungal-type domain-containing protein n=1 Tax=Gigaspora rosea TaxID=44941 RepID=A0A397V1Y2_9GLOM|nr:hypothetical protein C2G38_2097166 [Gigaspora rosea]
MAQYQSQVSTPSTSSSISPKCVSIKLADVNKFERPDQGYTKFKFFPTDSKDDIRQEISKAFSVESFSLVDEKEDHIITATWYSLEDNNKYRLIKRKYGSDTIYDNDNRRSSRRSKKNKYREEEKIPSDVDDNYISETDENENLAEDDKSKKRSHAKKACTHCRRAKKKCHQESIPCIRCVKNDLQCNLTQ